MGISRSARELNFNRNYDWVDDLMKSIVKPKQFLRQGKHYCVRLSTSNPG